MRKDHPLPLGGLRGLEGVSRGENEEEGQMGEGGGVMLVYRGHLYLSPGS